MQHNLNAVMLQVDAAKAAQAGHDYDINYRNTRIDEVRFLGFEPGGQSKHANQNWMTDASCIPLLPYVLWHCRLKQHGKLLQCSWKL